MSVCYRAFMARFYLPQHIHAHIHMYTRVCTCTHPFLLFKRKTRKHSGKVKDQQVSDWIAAVWMRCLWDPAVCVPTACSGQWLSDESKLCLLG